MPFVEIPPDIVVPNFGLASATQPFFGESVNGDALFIETGRIDSGTLLLLVDITGHGQRTIETMDTLRDSLGHPFYENRQPGELLQWLHDELAQQFDITETFVVALAVLVDSRCFDIRSANAGQPDPQLAQPGASWRTWALPRGMPLGIIPNSVTFQEDTTSFVSQESLLAFTDGVSEAGAKSHVPQFQHARLPAFLGRPPAVTPSDVVKELFSELQSHVGASWPDDDTTVVCLRQT